MVKIEGSANDDNQAGKGQNVQDLQIRSEETKEKP